ncbi:MAG: KEOPS complex subunit Pcc1 [Thermoplasmata archaeon]
MVKNSEKLTCSLTISVELDKKIARCVMDAIKVEIAEDGETDARTNLSMEYLDNCLHLIINAQDLSSLRASLNSYIRWLNLAIESAQLSNRQFPSDGEDDTGKDKN